MKDVPVANKMFCHGLDQTLSAAIAPILAKKGWTLENIEDEWLFLASITRHHPDVLLLLHDVIRCNAVKMLRQIRSVDLSIPVVIVAGESSKDLAFELINHGPIFLFRTLEETDLKVMMEKLSHVHRTDRGSAAPPLDKMKMWDIMEGGADWIWKLDPSDDISYSNDGTEKLLGYGPSHLRGRKIWDLVPAIHADSVRQEILRARAGRSSVRDLELKILAKDGSLVHMTATITPLYSFDGRYIGTIGKCLDVTARDLALERAEAAEEDHILLLESIPDPVVILDQQGSVRKVNHTAAKFFGWNRDEDMIGQNAFSFIREDDRERAMDDLKMLLRGELTGAKEYSVLRHDGSPMLVEVNGSITRNRSGGVGSVILVYRDVTEKARIRTELDDGRIRYQRLLESVPDIVWEIDRDLCFTYASQNVERITGFTADEVLGRAMFDIMEMGERVKLADRLESSLTQQEQFNDVLVNVKHKTGRHMIMEISGSPYYDEKGIFQGYRGIAHDATERIGQERAKYEIEERYRLIAENMSDSVWTSDLDLNMTYASPRTNNKRGIPLSEKMEDNMVRSIEQTSIERIKDAIREMTSPEILNDPSDRAEKVLEICILRPDGTSYRIEQRICLMRDPDGNAIGLLGVGRDVTEIRRAMEMTQSSLEKFLQLLDHAPDQVIIMNSAHDPPLIMEANQKACAELGYSKEELRLVPVADIVMGVRPHQFKEWDDRLRKDEIVVFEGFHRRKDGSFYDVETRLSRMTLGDETYVVGIVRNVTELKEQIRSMNKRNREMVAMNRLIRTSAMARNKDEVISSTIRLFDELFEFELSYYMALNEDGSIVSHHSDTDDLDGKERKGSIISELEMVQEAVQRNEPSFFPHAGEISSKAEELGIGSFCVLPVHLDRRPLGAMVLVSLNKEDISSSERELLTSAWSQVNDMIELLDHRGR